MAGRDELARALVDLQELAERLRRDCPWDRVQTSQTIVPHTVEEAYEVADTALAGDDEKLADELGDLLFQVYFLALLLAEKGSSDLERVALGGRTERDTQSGLCAHVAHVTEARPTERRGRMQALSGLHRAERNALRQRHRQAFAAAAAGVGARRGRGSLAGGVAPMSRPGHRHAARRDVSCG